jgi:hypothetical protein
METTMTEKTGFRQGDVMVIPAERIPPGAKEIADESGRVVLAEGEATGHAHALYGGRVKMFLADEGYGGGTYIDVPKGGDALKHEEHTPHHIPAGPHRVIRQVEYDLQDGVRTVAD